MSGRAVKGESGASVGVASGYTCEPGKPVTVKIIHLALTGNSKLVKYEAPSTLHSINMPTGSNVLHENENGRIMLEVSIMHLALGILLLFNTLRDN
jgi:hypothetical protein